MSNLELWNQVEKTDPRHTKEVNKGRTLTAICAQYQRKRATEMFGPAGIGWKTTNETYQFVQLDPQDCHHDILVYRGTLEYTWKDQVGQVPLAAEIDVWASRPKGWVKTSDLHKKVRTDALTKGLSEIGFNADVFLGMFDDNKYVTELREEFKEKDQGEKQGGRQGSSGKKPAQLESQAEAEKSVDPGQVPPAAPPPAGKPAATKPQERKDLAQIREKLDRLGIKESESRKESIEMLLAAPITKLQDLTPAQAQKVIQGLDKMLSQDLSAVKEGAAA